MSQTGDKADSLGLIIVACISAFLCLLLYHYLRMSCLSVFVPLSLSLPVFFFVYFSASICLLFLFISLNFASIGLYFSFIISICLSVFISPSLYLPLFLCLFVYSYPYLTGPGCIIGLRLQDACARGSLAYRHRSIYLNACKQRAKKGNIQLKETHTPQETDIPQARRSVQHKP